MWHTLKDPEQRVKPFDELLMESIIHAISFLFVTIRGRPNNENGGSSG
jgi:hypothetical protein